MRARRPLPPTRQDGCRSRPPFRTHQSDVVTSAARAETAINATKTTRATRDVAAAAKKEETGREADAAAAAEAVAAGAASAAAEDEDEHIVELVCGRAMFRGVWSTGGGRRRAARKTQRDPKWCVWRKCARPAAGGGGRNMICLPRCASRRQHAAMATLLELRKDPTGAFRTTMA